MPWTSYQSHRAAERIVRNAVDDVLAAIDAAALAVRDRAILEDRMKWDNSPTRADVFDFEAARADDEPNKPCPKCGETAEHIDHPISTGYGWGWGRVCNGCQYVKYMEPWT